MLSYKNHQLNYYLILFYATSVLHLYHSISIVLMFWIPCGKFASYYQFNGIDIKIIRRVSYNLWNKLRKFKLFCPFDRTYHFCHCHKQCDGFNPCKNDCIMHGSWIWEFRLNFEFELQMNKGEKWSKTQSNNSHKQSNTQHVCVYYDF